MKIGIFKGYSTDSRVKSTIESVVKGFEYLKANFFVAVEYQDCDIAVIWGVPSNRSFKKTKYRKVVLESQPNTIVVERGFIKRENYYSFSWNASIGNGDYNNKNMPSDRWDKLAIELKANKLNGKNIVVCGQVPHDTSVQHTDHVKWLHDIVAEIKLYTDRPIIFRPHPLYRDIIAIPEGSVLSEVSIEDEFKDSFAFVTFNSTSGVESTIEGIPTFSFDKGSMVYDITSHDIKQITQPPVFERKQWANDIAYSQWNIEEIEQGLPWLHLRKSIAKNI